MNDHARAPTSEEHIAANGSESAQSLCRALNEAIPGLDAACGLRHVRGRPGSYLRLLRTFADTRAADIEIILAHLSAANYAKLCSVIHNIKGVAGFLGAVRISALASELDSAVRAGCEAGEIDRLTTALIQAQRELAAGVFARADQAGAKS